MNNERRLLFERRQRFLDSDIGELCRANKNPIHGLEDVPILTLDEALKDFTSIIPNIKSLLISAIENCQKDSDPLTLEESAAIYLYTMPSSFFERLNQLLRAEDRNALKPWFGYLKLFLTGLNKLPSITATVWRGVQGQLPDNFLDNDVRIWWSVNSCSMKINIAQAFMGNTGTLFSIETINAKNISFYSTLSSEEEVVLMPGTHLRISGSAKLSKILHIIHLQEKQCESASNQQSYVTDNRPTIKTIKILEGDRVECIYPNGNRYVGQMKDDQRHGHGTCYYADGTKYVGNWANDQTNGEGSRTFLDGSRYEGTEINGKKHGQGTYWYENGEMYEGKWANDKRNGKGIYIYQTGVKFEGTYENNSRQGPYRLIHTNGQIEKGQCIDDKMYPQQSLIKRLKSIFLLTSK